MYKMEVDEAPRSSGRFKLDRIDRIAQEQKNEDLESWTPPQPVPSLRDLKSDWIRPLRVVVAVLGVKPSSTGGSQAQGIALLEMLEVRKIHTVTLMMGTNDFSRGESRKMMRLPAKVNCVLEELRIYLDPSVITICTVRYNLIADQNALIMYERVRYIHDINREIQKRSILPVRLLDVARMWEDSLPHDSSLDAMHFYKPMSG